MLFKWIEIPNYGNIIKGAGMRKTQNTFLLLLMLLIGLVIGGVLGDAFGSMLPFLAIGDSIGFAPFTIDLGILQMTLGLQMEINIAGIIGLLIAIIAYRSL